MADKSDITRDEPLRGVVLCCTALTPDVRTKLADTAAQMGAIHKLDLTSDVTHLLAGCINTPKLRYVAKDRPDIAVLRPEWIDAVRDAWVEGKEDWDLESLQKEYAMPPFFGLQISITGFEDLDQRAVIEQTITNGGGAYNGDMTKLTTHLIVADTKAKSAKYSHARQWGIQTVSYKWFEDSIERGLALEESLYGPEMPLEEQGINAFRRDFSKVRSVLGKRSRGGISPKKTKTGEGNSRRKLRKSASMRLEGKSQDLWQDMTAPEAQVDTTEVDVWDDQGQAVRTPRRERTAQPQHEEPSLQPAQDKALVAPAEETLFGGHFILIHGFDEKRNKAIRRYVEPNGAKVVMNPKELESADETPAFRNRCLLLPHDHSKLDLPQMPPGTRLVTEWWVERCIQNKRLLDPQEDALSQPLRKIADCVDLKVSTTGFTGIDLRQISQAVAIIGASYQEKLLPSTTVLISGPATIRKEKAYYASKHRIPVVSAEWFWTTLKLKKKQPFEGYLQEVPRDVTTEAAGVPTMHGPAQEDHTQRMSDNKHPKRLSNTRARQGTPALPLKLSGTTTPSMIAKPIEANKSRRSGPFILEDDDNEVDDSIPMQYSRRCSPVLSPSKAQPLTEISPNASQRSKFKKSPPPKPISPKRAVVELSCPEHGARSNSEFRGLDMVPVVQKQTPNPHINAQQVSDLAALLQNRAVSRAETADPLKRKKRPLGRSASWMSNPSISSKSERPADSYEVFDQADAEDRSAADGFYVTRDTSAVLAPASTQLGYEMDAPDDALRRQVGKQLGCTTLEQENLVPRRVASVGTVRDSEMVAMQEAKATRRFRVRR